MLNTNHPKDGILAKNENKGNRLNHITEMCILKYLVSSHLTAGKCSLHKTCWQEQSRFGENFQLRQLFTTLHGILRDQNVNIACLVIFWMIEVLRSCCETQTTVHNGSTYTYHKARPQAGIWQTWHVSGGSRSHFVNPIQYFYLKHSTGDICNKESIISCMSIHKRQETLFGSFKLSIWVGTTCTWYPKSGTGNAQGH